MIIKLKMKSYQANFMTEQGHAFLKLLMASLQKNMSGVYIECQQVLEYR